MGFSLRKLQSLPSRTRLRKIVLLLQSMELAALRGEPVDLDYLRGIVELLEQEPRIPQRRRGRIAELSREMGEKDLLRLVNGVRHLLLAELGAEPAEWDLLSDGESNLDPRAREVLDLRVYLEDLRSPFNVGSIFRTAESFGVCEILLSSDTPSPTHPRTVKTARGTTESVKWRRADLGDLQSLGSVFALETGGTDVSAFEFPRRGCVVLGSEELGVSPQALRLANDGGGKVSIPSAGAKRSLNVSVAFGIMMERWFEAVR